ncbi:hypothetical protein T07_13852 [Trichinella nelsoni]|uniref:FLYWCH-type domain-containing protein n=1 Tax=Trichinella nelsoni TaxID=6336 RepID=A0A0V0SEV0_9BILA|nr:hypothetical protein T07_13852 [Trichinella nelsoni]
MSIVYEGRAYKLKYTGKRRRDKKWCKDSVFTNLDVTSVLGQIPHMEACPMDPHLAYKMEKMAVLKKRSAEETKPIHAIYDKEASAEALTSGYFPVEYGNKEVILVIKNNASS